MNPIASFYFFILLIFFLGVTLMRGIVEAGNYKLYFNNVEQGANSTAQPSLKVINGEREIEESPEPVMETPVASTPSENAVVSTQQSVEPIHASLDKRKFKLSLLWHQFGERSDLRAGGKLGGSISAGFYPMKQLGLSLFGGTSGKNRLFWGGDLELIPLSVALFKHSDFIQIGGLLGASTIGRSHGLWGTAHAGARVGVNFDDQFGLEGSLRSNLTDRPQFKYWLATAGVAIRF